MQTEFELFTLGQLQQAGPEFLWPNDRTQVSVLSESLWKLAQSNPEHPPDMPVSATVSMDGKRVARIGLIQLGIEVGGNTFPCLTGHGLLSHPDVRAPGVGGLLMRQMFEALKARRIAFAAYGATPYANRLMTALRTVTVGTAPRWLLPLRSDPVVRQRFGDGTGSRLASLAGNVALRGWSIVQRARLRPAAKGLTVAERESIASIPDVDATGAPRVRFRRTPHILNWKRDFARLDVTARVRAFHIVDDNGRDVGCMLVRVATHAQVGSQQYKDVRICRVLDLLIPPSDDVARVALLGLLRIAASERADVLELLTTDARVSALCRSIGFRQSNGYDLLITRTDGLPEEVFDMNRWFLTMIEGEPAFS